MRAVLGIDAAWTISQPSGAVLARRRDDGWELVLASASYQDFVAGRGGCHGDRLAGSSAIAGDLLAAAGSHAGADVDVIAIDMPLSLFDQGEHGDVVESHSSTRHQNNFDGITIAVGDR